LCQVSTPYCLRKRIPVITEEALLEVLPSGSRLEASVAADLGVVAAPGPADVEGDGADGP
jgi:hypothetical protein